MFIKKDFSQYVFAISFLNEVLHIETSERIFSSKFFFFKRLFSNDGHVILFSCLCFLAADPVIVFYLKEVCLIWSKSSLSHPYSIN